MGSAVQPVADGNVDPLRAVGQQCDRVRQGNLTNLFDDAVRICQYDVAEHVAGLPRLDAQTPTELRCLDDDGVRQVRPLGDDESRFLEHLTCQSGAYRLTAVDHSAGRCPLETSILAAVADEHEATDVHAADPRDQCTSDD